MNDHGALDVAHRWRRAVEANDMVAFRGLYADDAAVWTNVDRATHPVEDHVQRVATARGRCERWIYEVVACQPTPTGFVSEHVVRYGVAGRERTAVAAVVAEVREGRITTLREYLDPTTTTTRGAST